MAVSDEEKATIDRIQRERTERDLERIATERATFPDLLIINGSPPTRIAQFFPINCACGPLAAPELLYIGRETIKRRLYCYRCKAELGTLVLPVDPAELEAQ